MTLDELRRMNALRAERLKRARIWSRITGLDLEDILAAWKSVPLGEAFLAVRAQLAITRDVLKFLDEKLSEAERAARPTVH